MRRALKKCVGSGLGVVLCLISTIVVADPPAQPAERTELDHLWRQADASERLVFDNPAETSDELSRNLQRAAAIFLRVAEDPEGNPSGYWRSARAEWLAGEFLPLEETDKKIEQFELAETLAQRGLEANPECGECMLWKFTSMGRLRTTRGLMTGLRSVSEMGQLLDDGIRLQPTHRDGDDNSSLGNLYYSSAIFYRMVPDSFWVGWLLGVRGDKQRSLADSRRALALHPTRLDFKVEVGTQLLCIGSVEDDAQSIADGRAILEEIVILTGVNEDERREIYFSKKLLEEPDLACGYTGDQIVDLEKIEAEAESGS